MTDAWAAGTLAVPPGAGPATGHATAPWRLEAAVSTPWDGPSFFGAALGVSARLGIVVVGSPLLNAPASVDAQGVLPHQPPASEAVDMQKVGSATLL